MTHLQLIKVKMSVRKRDWRIKKEIGPAVRLSPITFCSVSE